jgi:DnaJ-class molecular chaperone
MTSDTGERDRLDLLDYYTLLQIEQDATADEVQKAWHTFALKFHPDRHVGGSEPKIRRAAMIFRRGAEAVRVLLDSESRKRYDHQLATGKLRYDADVEDIRRSKRPGGGGSGVLSVRSAKARPFFMKAQQAMKNKDWQTAKLNLQIAQSHEPDNELILARLATVDVALAEMKKK